MAVQRKVSFYRLSLTRVIQDNKKKEQLLTNEQVRQKFETIYNNATSLSNDTKAVTVMVGTNHYVIEIMSYKEKCAFLKIGQQNPSSTVALRDRKTLESERVPMTETQLLELFTYALIDFDTCIVSYIGINGAPRISAIRGLFDNYYKEAESTYSTLAAIMTHDILKTLTKKKTISKLSVTVAVPNDKLLSDVISNEDDFHALQNVKNSTATYKITAPRNRTLFKKSSQLAEFIATLKAQYGDKLCKLKANAKDDNEKSECYDLLQYNFTRTVTLGSNKEALTYQDYQNALEATYTSHKDDLIRYCRQ